MVTRELLTSSQRAYFYEIPEYMDQREILRYYTISDEELKVINKQRGAANRLGFRTYTLKEYRELARLLLPMAMKTDKGHLLVEALITEMRKRKIILPAIYAIEHLAWAVRERAHRRIIKQLTRGLTPSHCKQLDRILSVGEGYKYSYISWLRQPPGAISVKNFHKILE